MKAPTVTKALIKYCQACAYAQTHYRKINWNIYGVAFGFPKCGITKPLTKQTKQRIREKTLNFVKRQGKMPIFLIKSQGKIGIIQKKSGKNINIFVYKPWQKKLTSAPLSIQTKSINVHN